MAAFWIWAVEARVLVVVIIIESRRDVNPERVGSCSGFEINKAEGDFELEKGNAAKIGRQVEGE